MPTPSQITDHAARAVARLALQLRNSASHKGLVLACARQVQEIEDALTAALVVRMIDTATAAQLDGIGAIVGAARESSTDSDYRARIKAQILVNRRSGEPETLIGILVILLPGALVTVVETQPASVEVTVTAVTIADPSLYSRLLQTAKAGGVKLVFRYQPAADASTFSMENGPGLGFGDTGNPSTGGQFAGAV